MTWPDGIAIAVGVTTLYLLTHTPHPTRSTTQTQPRTEADHGHHSRQDHSPQDHSGEEDGPSEEDRRPEAGGR